MGANDTVNIKAVFSIEFLPIDYISYFHTNSIVFSKFCIDFKTIEIL